jgi:hypothetical protein
MSVTRALMASDVACAPSSRRACAYAPPNMSMWKLTVRKNLSVAASARFGASSAVRIPGDTFGKTRSDHCCCGRCSQLASPS